MVLYSWCYGLAVLFHSITSSAKTSVLAHAVFQGLTCRNFFNMPNLNKVNTLSPYIQNGMFKAKNEQTACSILNSMLKIQHVEIGIQHVENR
jgi:hypothetical protein